MMTKRLKNSICTNLLLSLNEFQEEEDASGSDNDQSVDKEDEKELYVYVE